MPEGIPQHLIDAKAAEDPRFAAHVRAIDHKKAVDARFAARLAAHDLHDPSASDRESREDGLATPLCAAPLSHVDRIGDSTKLSALAAACAAAAVSDAARPCAEDDYARDVARSWADVDGRLHLPFTERLEASRAPTT